MDRVVTGWSTSQDLFQLAWGEVRHLLAVAAWLLVAALAAAAGCWCCAYGVREAWIRGGPPRRRPRAAARDDDPVASSGPCGAGVAGAAGAGVAGALEKDVEQVLDLVLVEEAQRGIVAIEAFLACAGDGGPAAP